MKKHNSIDLEIEKLSKYEKLLDGMTEEEHEELSKWIALGNSIYSNPYFIYEESGRLADFITASRLAKDMTL